MPIDLGLARVTKLLKHLGNPHLTYHSIHVAGTNGKGSTIAYLSSIFKSSNIKNGRFTSPHMLYYNDCISIDESVYPLTKFQEVSILVQSYNAKLELGCTEFELLTATAYKIFEIEKVSLAVIEVGLGGRLDATNVLEPPSLLVTAITKIAMDHENLLGSTLGEIAKEKAGIMKNGVPVVFDDTNEGDVIQVIIEKSKELKCNMVPAQASLSSSLIRFSPLKGEYQLQNLSIALNIVDIIRSYPDYGHKISSETILEGIKQTNWQGRLQTVLIDGSIQLLIDGAHNESAAIELGKYLNSSSQQRESGLVFIIAMTKGKNIDSLIKHLNISDRDTIILTDFTIPENMPWIRCSSFEDLKSISEKYTKDVQNGNPGGIHGVINQAASVARGRQIVTCGSLYLCSDVLRLVEQQTIQ